MAIPPSLLKVFHSSSISLGSWVLVKTLKKTIILTFRGPEPCPWMIPLYSFPEIDLHVCPAHFLRPPSGSPMLAPHLRVLCGDQHNKHRYPPSVQRKHR